MADSVTRSRPSEKQPRPPRSPSRNVDARFGPDALLPFLYAEPGYGGLIQLSGLSTAAASVGVTIIAPGVHNNVFDVSSELGRLGARERPAQMRLDDLVDVTRAFGDNVTRAADFLKHRTLVHDASNPAVAYLLADFAVTVSPGATFRHIEKSNFTFTAKRTVWQRCPVHTTWRMMRTLEANETVYVVMDRIAVYEHLCTQIFGPMDPRNPSCLSGAFQHASHCQRPTCTRARVGAIISQGRHDSFVNVSQFFEYGAQGAGSHEAMRHLARAVVGTDQVTARVDTLHVRAGRVFGTVGPYVVTHFNESFVLGEYARCFGGALHAFARRLRADRGAAEQAPVYVATEMLEPYLSCPEFHVCRPPAVRPHCDVVARVWNSSYAALSGLLGPDTLRYASSQRIRDIAAARPDIFHGWDVESLKYVFDVYMCNNARRFYTTFDTAGRNAIQLRASLRQRAAPQRAVLDEVVLPYPPLIDKPIAMGFLDFRPVDDPSFISKCRAQLASFEGAVSQHLPAGPTPSSAAVYGKPVGPDALVHIHSEQGNGGMIQLSGIAEAAASAGATVVAPGIFQNQMTLSSELGRFGPQPRPVQMQLDDVVNVTLAFGANVTRAVDFAPHVSVVHDAARPAVAYMFADVAISFSPSATGFAPGYTFDKDVYDEWRPCPVQPAWRPIRSLETGEQLYVLFDLVAVPSHICMRLLPESHARKGAVLASAFDHASHCQRPACTRARVAAIAMPPWHNGLVRARTSFPFGSLGAGSNAAMRHLLREIVGVTGDVSTRVDALHIRAARVFGTQHHRYIVSDFNETFVRGEYAQCFEEFLRATARRILSRRRRAGDEHVPIYVATEMLEPLAVCPEFLSCSWQHRPEIMPRCKLLSSLWQSMYTSLLSRALGSGVLRYASTERIAAIAAERPDIFHGWDVETLKYIFDMYMCANARQLYTSMDTAGMSTIALRAASAVPQRAPALGDAAAAPSANEQLPWPPHPMRASAGLLFVDDPEFSVACHKQVAEFDASTGVVVE